MTTTHTVRPKDQQQPFLKGRLNKDVALLNHAHVAEAEQSRGRPDLGHSLQGDALQVRDSLQQLRAALLGGGCSGSCPGGMLPGVAQQLTLLRNLQVQLCKLRLPLSDLCPALVQDFVLQRGMQ